MPNVLITNISKNVISRNEGANSSDVTFSFDSEVRAVTVNVGGYSHITGKRVYFSELRPKTVAELKQQSVLELKAVSLLAISKPSMSAGTEITVTVPHTLLVSGENRVNIYGRNIRDEWTSYER
jgi:hypothetical protein